MKFNVVAFKNRDLGCFSKPAFDDRNLENIKTTCERSLKEGLIKSEQATRLQFKNCAFMLIGTFDDETGVFENVADTCIVDCNQILCPEEVVPNGNYSKEKTQTV